MSMRGNGRGVQEVETGDFRSFDDIFNDALSIARHLPGPRGLVSCLLPNSIDYITLYVASVLSSTCFAPLPYFLSSFEVAGIVGKQRPTIVVTDRTDVVTRHNSGTVVCQLSQLKSRSGVGVLEASEEASGALYMSSGTTSSPKGVLYSHGNFDALIQSLVATFDFSDTSRHLALLPFGHTAALNYSVFPSLLAGSNLFVSRGFQNLRTRFFETMSQLSITYCQIVPTVAHALLKVGESTARLASLSLDYVGCGSAPLPAVTQQAFEERFGIRLANLYGLSETGPTHFDDPRLTDWQPGSIGVPLSVNDCTLNEQGEMLIRGPNVFTGYFEEPEAYRAVVRDGWFNTGDLGRFDGKRFYFSDRRKDVMIVAGINILPSEIESVLYSVKDVAECAVFSIKSGIAGEDIIAVIYSSDAAATHQVQFTVQERLRETLSPFKRPRRVVLAAESLPKTESGKISRRIVKQRFLEGELALLD